MTKNNVDVKAANRNPQTNESTCTFAELCDIFDVAFLFSVICNKK